MNLMSILKTFLAINKDCPNREVNQEEFYNYFNQKYQNYNFDDLDYYYHLALKIFHFFTLNDVAKSILENKIISDKMSDDNKSNLLVLKNNTKLIDLDYFKNNYAHYDESNKFIIDVPYQEILKNGFPKLVTYNYFAKKIENFLEYFRKNDNPTIDGYMKATYEHNSQYYLEKQDKYLNTYLESINAFVQGIPNDPASKMLIINSLDLENENQKHEYNATFVAVLMNCYLLTANVLLQLIEKSPSNNSEKSVSDEIIKELSKLTNNDYILDLKLNNIFDDNGCLKVESLNHSTIKPITYKGLLNRILSNTDEE